ncbi:MAG: hypothetical protein JRN20_17425 [Nitrososphaerota archaeon]|nr:hypothetical protein [Nitrososphaerota archaeon]
MLSDEVLKVAKEMGITIRRYPRSVPIEEAADLFEKYIGKKEEISEKESIDKVTTDAKYDLTQAKEMLRMPYRDYRIVIMG